MNEKLNDYVGNYNYRNSIMEMATTYCGKIFADNMVQGSVLELGPAEGIMTEKLYPLFSDYTVVDGSTIYAERMKKDYPNINVICSFFEDYKPDRKFDNIILGHVLEHVDNPIEILKLCRNWLCDNGRILSAVPNSHSLHRQSAVIMGLLERENQLNETDKGIGHQRVYDLKMLQRDFAEANLKVLKSGGYWIKPLSNSQIDLQWTDEMKMAYMILGEKFPDISAEIYVIATV